MTRRCAWCRCVLPAQPGDEDGHGLESHGICDRCLGAIDIGNHQLDPETEVDRA
jgi:hypothetical protein